MSAHRCTAAAAVLLLLLVTSVLRLPRSNTQAVEEVIVLQKRIQVVNAPSLAVVTPSQPVTRGWYRLYTGSLQTKRSIVLSESLLRLRMMSNFKLILEV